MYKVVILILSLVCGVRVGKAVEALPETTVASSFQLYQELGLRGEVNFPAFEQALKGFSRYASGQDRLLVLIDYTKPSTEKRFYILDLLQKKLLLSTYVAHGRGSGDNYAVAFSNRPGSYQSSLGFFRTGDTYMGKNGYSLFLDGLEKGVKYTLKGWEMMKSENAELLVNGKRVENDLTFTAEDSKMEIQIEFTFNASELGGKELVTFEELYDVTNPDNPIKVAEHKDIKDKGQTVTVKEKPESPATSEEPSTPTRTGNSPKTGDNTPFAALFAMMGISAAGLIFAGYKRFRKVKKVK